MKEVILHIPEGIRFECTGCGNCCLGWPVPLTRDDVARIDSLKLQQQNHSFCDSMGGWERACLKDLQRKDDRRYEVFSHVLEKRRDGRCAFLMDDFRCYLHAGYGETSKPSMCRIFPYAFNETPDGVFAYVSFAASGSLYNKGRLLKEQADVLQDRYQLYRKLFPAASKDWSKLQLLDGCSLQWRDYREIEQTMLSMFAPGVKTNVIDALIDCSRLIVSRLPASTNPEALPPMSVAPHMVDLILLRHLFLLFLPDDVYGEAEFDLDVRKLMSDISSDPKIVSLPIPSSSDCISGSSAQELMECRLTEIPAMEQINSLLARFIYSRIYAKLYFGPGHGHLSLLSGIHNLFMVVLLIMLRTKQLILSRAEHCVNFEDTAEILRVIERRWIQLNLSAPSCAVLEVLLSSPSRLARLRKLAD